MLKTIVRVSPVDFHGNRQDLMCLQLGARGFGSFYIAKRCRLSEGQVNYRLKKAGIVRGDIRRGESRLTSLLVSNLGHSPLDEAIVQDLIHNGLWNERSR